jgi:hypothetical protein
MQNRDRPGRAQDDNLRDCATSTRQIVTSIEIVRSVA